MFEKGRNSRMLSNEQISIKCSENLSKNSDYQRLNDEIIKMSHEVMPILIKNGYQNIDRLKNVFIEIETCIQDECYQVGYKDGVDPLK